MKEIIGLATIEEVKAITSTVEGDRNIVAPVHCSMLHQLLRHRRRLIPLATPGPAHPAGPFFTPPTLCVIFPSR